MTAKYDLCRVYAQALSTRSVLSHSYGGETSLGSTCFGAEKTTLGRHLFIYASIGCSSLALSGLVASDRGECVTSIGGCLVGNLLGTEDVDHSWLSFTLINLAAYAAQHGLTKVHLDLCAAVVSATQAGCENNSTEMTLSAASQGNVVGFFPSGQPMK